MGSLEHTPSASEGVGARWSDLPRGEIFVELDRILESHHFRTSKKCSHFLRYIVEAAVEGRFDCLKERSLGVEVFDREPRYDTNHDPIVRGTAGEVRKRLAQYYLDAGPGELRFSLPPGSYIPEIHYSTVERPTEAQVLTKSPKHRNWFAIIGIGLVVPIILAVGSWVFLRPTPVERFWAPVLTGKAVLVCMGQPQFYIFHSDTARVLNSWFARGSDSHQKSPPIASVPVDQIVPMWGSSVALADAQAFSRLVNFFARKGQQVDLRGDRSVSLSDLRGEPSVFIGAFDNDWTLNLAGELRFYFDTGEQTHAQIIRDRQRPAATDWKLVDAWPPGKDISEDYALVTRVANRTTERTIVILGGIAQYGTEAAAEFVTNPTYFERALVHAPKDWYRRNMQIVLSTRVLSGVSGPPTVVAAYFW
ncbi:MAG: hypothetical protein JOY54_02245 [Acidobacteriaceae bacterium]|nr:hypothetical protein [Acidobacteriaceae bacterium]